MGGLVRLSTSPANHEGFGLQYVQGVGSFSTFDEFLRLTYGDKHWQSSTRVVYSSSPNDYKYRNRDKKENIYDEDKNIIGSYYPTERNRSGAYKDLHVLQEIYYNTGEGDKFGLNAWYINSNRELAMLSTDYGNDMDFENRQREQTFRGVLSWDRVREKWKVGVKGGYIHTWMAYDYKRDKGNGEMASMTRSRSKINTFYGSADGDYAPSEKWLMCTCLCRNPGRLFRCLDGILAILLHEFLELEGSLAGACASGLIAVFNVKFGFFFKCSAKLADFSY